MLLKIRFIAASAALLLAAVGCAGQPETIEVEVTREVPVTQEVPVTVETVRDVEVTREVPVTQEVRVTVVVPQTVEVTREVIVPQVVEVTREVTVTRVAEVATPAPTAAQTVAPDTPTATRPPTMSPTAAHAPTPTPPASTQFDSWTIEEPEHYGEREIHRFRNVAVDQQTGDQPPTLTYQCDTRGDRSMYIDWGHPITATSSDHPSSSRDPFSQYRDIPFYALLEYFDGLLDFVDDLRLIPREQNDLDEIWDKVEDRWLIGQGASQLGSDPTPDALVDLLRDRTLRSVEIDLDFYQEFIDPSKEGQYGPPSLATISGLWIVLSDSTQINHGSLGELRQAIRWLYSAPFSENDKRLVMTATIKGPGQPVVTLAKWDARGIRQVLSHCQALRRF